MKHFAYRARSLAFLALLIAAPVPVVLAAPATKCQPDAPYRYRVVLEYIGGKKSPSERGTITQNACIEREIKTEADWSWLHDRYETDPEVTRVTIVSATPISE